MQFPCFQAARRERSFPAFVLGPRAFPPCILHVAFSRMAQLWHCSFERLLRAAHCLNDARGSILGIATHPLPTGWTRNILSDNCPPASVIDVHHLHDLFASGTVFYEGLHGLISHVEDFGSQHEVSLFVIKSLLKVRSMLST